MACLSLMHRHDAVVLHFAMTAFYFYKTLKHSLFIHKDYDIFNTVSIITNFVANMYTYTVQVG